MPERERRSTSGWPRTDMHLHATHYRLDGARPEMTVANIARWLEEGGYEAAGIVEHLDRSPKHPLSSLEALVGEFRTIRSTIHLYVGAEVEYRGDGITIPESPQIKRRLGLDYYLAAAHGVEDGVTSTAAFIEDHHRRLMGIVACDFVDVVAHPWTGGHSFARRGLIEQWQFGLIPERYLREFVDAAKHYGKAIELNSKALADVSDPAFGVYLEMLRASQVAITIGSDAHSAERMGAAVPLMSLLQDAGLDADRLWEPAQW